MASTVILSYDPHSNVKAMKQKNGSKIAQRCAIEMASSGAPFIAQAVAESEDRKHSLPSTLNKPQVPVVSVKKSSDTISEDTFSVKRKSMCLNGGVGGELTLKAASSFSCQTIHLQNLSGNERKKLRNSLKLELEQIQSLNMRLEAKEAQLKEQYGTMQESQNSLNLPCRVDQVNGETPQPLKREGSASQPGSKEKRTPKVNQLYVNSDFLLSGKDKPPPPSTKSLSGLKRSSVSGKSAEKDPKKPRIDAAGVEKKLAELMKQCGVLLKRLMVHKFSWVFNEPVDVVKLNLLDYFSIIQKPMDLGTIKRKLGNNEYGHPQEFAGDVRLTFANAMEYNPPGHDVHIMAEALKKIFEDRWKSVEPKLAELETVTNGTSQCINEPEVVLSNCQEQPPVTPVKTIQETEKKKKAVKPPKSDLNIRQMSYEEKTELSKSLLNLPPEKAEKILQIIRSRETNLTQTDDEIEIDMESFDDQTLWELHKFVKECDMRKPEQEAVLRTELGGGGKGKEEAGACDNNTQAAVCSPACPPVVVDKGRGGSRHSSSSSSSSNDSGSSSSGGKFLERSGSGGTNSSGGSDAGDVESSGAAKLSPKAQVATGATHELNGNSISQTNGGKCEDAAEEQQMSPGKRSRAALLKNRFADTILKAQEKTLPLSSSKGDVRDPEKLRREREDLERRRREEKVRLLAEAKAAKKAKQMAEAEARRKIEEEREAARLALQQMERTVEIDENCEILKDLEMLRSAPSSCGDETSPEQLPDGLSRAGVNPLEQLGLFMKEDDEEEEHQHIFPLSQSLHHHQGSRNGTMAQQDDEEEEGEIED